MRSDRFACFALIFCLFATSVVAAPLRIVVVSDLNGSYGSVDYAPRVARAMEAIVRLGPDLVLSTGDMVAGQRRPHLSDAQVRAMWRGFHAVVSDPLEAAGIPFAVTPGNHDASAYRGFELERRIYADQWQSRRPNVEFVDGRDYPFFYAFDMGGVRFVSLDATTVGALGQDQMARLDAVLEGADGPSIAFSHLPLWPVSVGRETQIIGSTALSDLFERRHLTMHLSGHHHAYYPGVSDGIAYIAQACLGSGARRLIGESGRSAHGFTVLDVAEDGTLSVHARLAPDYEEVWPISELPSRIVSDVATLTRLDLSGLSAVRAGGE